MPIRRDDVRCRWGRIGERQSLSCGFSSSREVRRWFPRLLLPTKTLSRVVNNIIKSVAERQICLNRPLPEVEVTMMPEVLTARPPKFVDGETDDGTSGEIVLSAVLAVERTVRGEGGGEGNIALSHSNQTNQT